MNIILSVCGLLLRIWLLTSAYIILRTSCGTLINFHMLRSQLRKFMAFAKLFESTQRRILTFYDSSFNGNYFRRHEINKILGDKLQLAVKMDCFGTVVKSNSFFQMLPDEMIPSVVSSMKELLYLDEEVLKFNQSEVGFN